MEPEDGIRRRNRNTESKDETVGRSRNRNRKAELKDETGEWNHRKKSENGTIE